MMNVPVQVKIAFNKAYESITLEDHTYEEI
jgi:hypothetical protein